MAPDTLVGVVLRHLGKLVTPFLRQKEDTTCLLEYLEQVNYKWEENDTTKFCKEHCLLVC